MAKIFISGVAGFLGSHLADRMLEKGHRVVGCDNMLGGDQGNVNKAVEFHNADCRDLEKMKEITKEVDVVYHCAAAPHEGLSVFSPVLITEHTYNSTIALATAAIINGVKRFIFTSSMARYGKQDTLPFTEEMTPRPLDPYGIAKYAGEQTIAALGKAHGMEYVHAVPHNIIGSRQKYDDPFRNVAAIMINLMLQDRQPIIYGDGEQKRCFSFVQDCVDSFERMAFQDNVIGETINIGPDEETVTINELYRVLAKIMDFKKEPIYMADRPLEVKLAACSADKARRLLGYQTHFGLEDGLREMAEWIKSKGPKPFVYHLPLEIITDKTPRTWKEKLF